MTSVAVNVHAYSATYVADNILKSMKDIIRLSGLDPRNLVEGWTSAMQALQTWLHSEHLETVILEILHPSTGALVGRWDIDVIYTTGLDDDGFWTDTEQIKYHVCKAGLAPSEASYRLVLQNKPGYPTVSGWGPTRCRSTKGFVRHSLGPTIEHYGLGASAAYWRQV